MRQGMSDSIPIAFDEGPRACSRWKEKRTQSRKAIPKAILLKVLPDLR